MECISLFATLLTAGVSIFATIFFAHKIAEIPINSKIANEKFNVIKAFDEIYRKATSNYPHSEAEVSFCNILIDIEFYFDKKISKLCHQLTHYVSRFCRWYIADKDRVRIEESEVAFDKLEDIIIELMFESAKKNIEIKDGNKLLNDAKIVLKKFEYLDILDNKK